MKHLNVLVIKFLVSFLVFWISLGLFFEASLGVILSFSLLVTFVAYFLGDLVLLPRLGNNNAVIVDFFLTYLIVWIFGAFFLHSYMQIAWGSIIAATLIAGSELFVHSYILKTLPIKKIRLEKERFHQDFAFETSEESNPNIKKK
ncbi:MAG: YndM family protein [Bacillus sp. (in: Bacteria)]|nr:YndM family protein [Bacillus sp. (in: firmicutes)]